MTTYTELILKPCALIKITMLILPVWLEYGHMQLFITYTLYPCAGTCQHVSPATWIPPGAYFLPNSFIQLSEIHLPSHPQLTLGDVAVTGSPLE